MSVRRIWLVVVIAIVAACGGGAASVPSAGTGIPATTVPGTAVEPTAMPSPALPAGVSRIVQLGQSAYGIAAADDSVWVEGVDHLLQLDARTGEQRRDLPGVAPTVDARALWYVRGHELVEADPQTGAERATFAPAQLGTAVADGMLWAASEEDEVLYGIDLESNEVLHETRLPRGEPKWVQPWEGAVWVVIDGVGSGVVRVDPETGKVLSNFETPGKRPHSAVAAFGSFWVTDHGSANLYRLSPDGKLEATIPGPGWEVAIAATDDAIWAASPRALLRVDLATNTVAGEIEIGAGDWYGLAYAGGYLWLTTGEGKRLLQLPIPTS